MTCFRCIEQKIRAWVRSRADMLEENQRLREEVARLRHRNKSLTRNLSMVAKELFWTQTALGVAERLIYALDNPGIQNFENGPKKRTVYVFERWKGAGDQYHPLLAQTRHSWRIWLGAVNSRPWSRRHRRSD